MAAGVDLMDVVEAVSAVNSISGGDLGCQGDRGADGRISLQGEKRLDFRSERRKSSLY